MTTTQAPDHFSVQAAAYKDFRPTYPAAFFDWLVQIAPSSALAWDCGCGSGQASADLARRFGRVIGTDLSRKQLDLAVPAANVEYRCEAAEHSTLAAASVDLTLVAQALHWFDHASFYNEVRRVSKKNARLVALTYNLLQVTPAIDELVGQLYWETLRGYWPAGREHVENGYHDIPFPFERLVSPAVQPARRLEPASPVRLFRQLVGDCRLSPEKRPQSAGTLPRRISGRVGRSG